MRIPMQSMLACGAAVLAAAAVTPAVAGDGQVHVLLVQLPGGGIEQIQYTGDVAPRVVLVPAQSAVAQSPVAMPMFAPSPFATLERLSAMMDRQAAAMLQQAQAMAAARSGAMPGLPAGVRGYSFVSTMSGNAVCMRSVRITFNGGYATPQVVSSMSGDCGHRARPPAPINAPAPAIRPTPHTIEVRAVTPAQDPAARQEVAWNR